MPRKKQTTSTTSTAQAPDDAATAVAASSATATAELSPETAEAVEAPEVQPAAPPAPPLPAMRTTARPQHAARRHRERQPAGRPCTWAVPYQPIFVSQNKGFEMGENRRFKQRVFFFKDKPDEHIRAMLKEHGFVYRPAEKAWTIEASATNRVLSEHLAKVFAGFRARA